MDSEDKETKFNLKILIIGDAGVGKTAIIQKYVNNFYPEMYKQSLGCNFFSKKLDLTKSASATLSIWDCSSNILFLQQNLKQKQFFIQLQSGESLKSKMLNTYIYGSDAVLFVYDITNRSSFEAIPNLVKLVQTTLSENNKVEYGILGNKSDLFNQIAVEEDSAQKVNKQEIQIERINNNLCIEKLSSILNIPYYSVSAKMGSNLNECFNRVTFKICNIPLPAENNKQEKIQESSLPDLRSEVKTNLQPSKTSSGCFIF